MDEIILVILEMLAIIVCLYNMHHQKVRFDLAFFALIIYDILLCYGISTYSISLNLSISLYIIIFIYSLYEFKEKMITTFIECFLTIFIIGIMQLILYIPVSMIIRNPYEDILIGCLVNGLCLLATIFFTNKFKIHKILEYIDQRNTLAYICFVIIVLYFGIQTYSLRTNYHWDNIHFAEVIIWLLLVLVLWIQAQKNRVEKIRKETQLQEQEQYVKSFEEQLDLVKFKQHDMKNHLSAFCGLMEEVIDDNERLSLTKEYCDYLLNDKDYKRLVNSGNPIFTGFLNIKIQEMEKKEINFQYESAYIELGSALSVYEWIEVTGILLNNAAEAVENQPKELKRIRMKLSQTEKQIILKVSNISRYIDNVESTAFFQKGYSTKGNGRGIGLAKIKELVLKKNGEIIVRNIKQDNLNWIEFTVCMKN